MAGIVVGLGDKTERYIGRIRQNFGSCKGLKASYETCVKKCKIIKYKRRYDKEDNNYFESQEIVLCAVGSVLYKDFGFKDSIQEVGKSLSEGARVSEIINEIDGTFFIIIINSNERKCYIITDVGGAINTYIIKKNRSFFISTSMLALASTFNVTPDSKSILMFIRTGMFFDDTTYFREISALKPASIYEYDIDVNMDHFGIQEYWRVPKNVIEDISLADAGHTLTKALSHIIEKIPNEDTIYDFTGGYDSRFVLSFAYSRALIKKSINSFFFGPPNSRESKIVRNTCINLGITYNNYLLPNEWAKIYFDYVLEANDLCDGMISACEYAPVLWAQKKKRENFEYSVLGLFGEIYRGFTAKQEFFLAGRKRQANLQRFINYRNLTMSFNSEIFSSEFSEIIKQILKYILKTYEQTNRQLDSLAPNTLQLDNIYFTHRMRRWGGRGVTTSNQLIRQVCPLWFRKPLTFSFSLPHNTKARERLMRHIVGKIAPEIARAKTISGAPFLLIDKYNIILFLPAVIFYFLKANRKFFEVVFKRSILEGLTLPNYDVGEWYREALKDPRCRNLLDFDKMASKLFYDKKRFNQFIQRAKTENFHFYGQLGNMITVELTLQASNLNFDIEK